MHRDLPVRLLHGVGPAAHVVAQLVGREIGWVQPAARLETDDVEPRLREGQHGDAAHRAEPDDDDVGPVQLNGHRRPPNARQQQARWAW